MSNLDAPERGASASAEPADVQHARFRAHRAGLNTAAPLPVRDEQHWIATRPREAAITYVTEFLARLLSIQPDKISRITDPAQSRQRGDLTLPSGKTVEVKARPVNPGRFPLTRIEVASLPFDPRHVGGAAQLAYSLGLDAVTLAAVGIQDFSTPLATTEPFGSPDHISVDITSMLGATVTIFANPALDVIYIYRRDELAEFIRKGILNGSLRRGEYPDRPDTLTLLIPLPRWRFSKDRADMWRYTGLGAAETEKALLRKLLAVAGKNVGEGRDNGSADTTSTTAPLNRRTVN